MVNKWKVTAIIFIILFTLETLYFIWAIKYTLDEENKTLECYYEICEDYPDAWREGDLCYCYDYDVMGELTLAKTKVMK